MTHRTKLEPVVEPQGDGYPWIGETGAGDMVSTEPVDVGKRHVIVDREAYELLISVLLKLDDQREQWAGEEVGA